MLFLYKNSVFPCPKLYECWGKGGGIGSQRVTHANFIAQSATGCRDFCVQIQKFWNIYSNLDYKENSFYPFPSLFRQKSVFLTWSVLEHLEIKDFLHHQPWSGQWLGSLVNLCIPESGHYLAPPKFKSCVGLWKSKLMKSGKNYWNIIKWGKVILGTFS